MCGVCVVCVWCVCEAVFVCASCWGWQLLAVVNGDNTLLLLTKDFDVVAEQPALATDFGLDAPITVGRACRLQRAVVPDTNFMTAGLRQAGAKKRHSFKAKPESWHTKPGHLQQRQGTVCHPPIESRTHAPRGRATRMP